jgi:hypothetical protein
MEITTLFLVLSIGFYVFLFWRSQLQAKSYSRTDRRKTGVPKPQLHPRRRLSDRTQTENLVINQLFEEEEDPGNRSATNH